MTFEFSKAHCGSVSPCNHLDQGLPVFSTEVLKQFATLTNGGQALRIALDRLGKRAQITGDIVNNFQVGLAVSAWELDFFGRIASLKGHVTDVHRRIAVVHHSGR